MSAGARKTASVVGAARRASGSGRARRGATRSTPPLPLQSVSGALITGRVHLLQRIVDRQQPAREASVHDLGEAVLALALDHVAGTADEVVGPLLALHQLGEVGGVGSAEVLDVDVD